MVLTHNVIFRTLLDMLSFGIVALDSERKPFFFNASAARHIGENRPFYIDRSGTLRAAHAEVDKKLNENISVFSRTAAKRRILPIPIRSEENGSLILAWVSPLPESDPEKAFADGQGAARLTGLIITEKSGHEAADSAVADMFGLTPAEARLVQSLVKGISPSQYAVQKCLSQNTVRNQLKSVFAKTEVRRQSDLVGLVSTLIPPVDFDRTTDG